MKYDSLHLYDYLRVVIIEINVTNMCHVLQKGRRLTRHEDSSPGSINLDAPPNNPTHSSLN